MSTADTVPAPPGRLYWLLWLATAIVCCAPLWLVEVPPLSDYYNHLARLYIVAEYDAVAEYRAFYAVEWGLYPNLALELIGVPLLEIASLAVVAKLFASATVVLWQLGTTLLGRAVYGRLTWRALIAGFFVYNQQFLHGYMNFAFAMGLALIALALWIGSRHRWTAVRFVGVAALAVLAYFAHLLGFATLAVAVTAMTVSRGVRVGRRPGSRRGRLVGNLITGLLPLVPPTALFAVATLDRADAGMGVSWSPLTYNIRDALTLLTGYDPILDAASAGVLALLVVVALVFRVRLGLRTDLFVAGLALAALYWVVPSDLGTGQEVNVRFALGAFTLLVFAVDLVVNERDRIAVFLLALGLFSARVGTTAAYFVELDDRFAEQVAALDRMAPGATLHNITFYPMPRVLNARRVYGLALIHAPAFAAVRRRANVPTLYALPDWSPLSHREAVYRAHRFRDGARPDIPWDQVFATYDYVWTCRAPAALVAPLTDRAEIVAEAAGCTLYQLPGPGSPER